MNRYMGSVIGASAATPIESSTALASVYEILLSANKQLCDVETRLSRLGARMFGSEPVPIAGANEKEMSDPPMIRRLEDAAGMIHRQADLLSQAAERLERL